MGRCSAQYVAGGAGEPMRAGDVDAMLQVQEA